MKNVRCAGGGTIRKRTSRKNWDLTNGQPCGWAGYRTPHPALGVPTKTLPCPRCDGHVEPIPREARP